MSHCVQQDLIRVCCPYSLFECQLCMEEFESPRVFPCQHIFCRNCVSILIARSLRARNLDDGKLKCPVCRRPIKLDSAKSSNTEELLESFPESLLLKSFLEYKESGPLKFNDACVGTELHTQHTTSSSQTEYCTNSAFTQTERDSCTTSSQTDINKNIKSTQTRCSLKTISSQTECNLNTKITEFMTNTISTQTEFLSILDVFQLLCLCINQHVRALLAYIQRHCTPSVLFNCFWKHNKHVMGSILVLPLVIRLTYTEPESPNNFRGIMYISDMCFIICILLILLLVEVCLFAHRIVLLLILLVRDAFILTRSVFKIAMNRLRTDEVVLECVHDDNPSYDDNHCVTMRHRRIRERYSVPPVRYLYSTATRRHTRRGVKHKTTYIKQQPSPFGPGFHFNDSR